MRWRWRGRRRKQWNQSRLCCCWWWCTNQSVSVLRSISTKIWVIIIMMISCCSCVIVIYWICSTSRMTWLSLTMLLLQLIKETKYIYICLKNTENYSSLIKRRFMDFLSSYKITFCSNYFFVMLYTDWSLHEIHF